MRALVIGASGFVGEYLMLEGQTRQHDVSGTYTAKPEPHLTYLDATDFDAVHRYVESNAPDWVFMTAANPHVDLCEREPDSTARINTEAVRHVAEACATVGSQLMFFSTDYVFDGEDGPYDEDASPNPLSEYGRQKLAAEHAVAELLPDGHVIARFNVVYVWEKHGTNFFVRLLRNLRFGETATIPNDQFSTPTYVGDIAFQAWDVVEGGGHGIFHLTGPDYMDRYTFSLNIASAFDINTAQLSPVSTSDLSQSAPRPMQGGLISNRISAYSAHDARPVKSALELLYEQESILAGGRRG